jgi:hypothetical protein
MFAAVCVPFAALGHIVMSGTGIPGWTLLSAGAVSAAVGWAFTGRERGRAFVTAATVVVQLVLHSLFSLGQAVAAARGTGSLAQQWAAVLLCGTEGAARMSPADAERVVRTAGLGSHLNGPPPGMSSMPGMAGSHTAASTHAMGAMAMPGMGAMSHGYGLVGMVLAHVVAAALCGIWLAYGERAAFQLAGRPPSGCSPRSPCSCGHPRRCPGRCRGSTGCIRTGPSGRCCSLTPSSPGGRPARRPYCPPDARRLTGRGFQAGLTVARIGAVAWGRWALRPT